MISSIRSGGNRRKSRTTLAMVGVFFLAVLAAVILWKIIAYIYDYRVSSHKYDEIIINASRRNGIDPALVKAVIWRESRFHPYARGRAGEIGLMQIMPDQAVVDWSRRFGRPVPSRGPLFSPELNIEIGSWYLSNAVRRWSGYRYGVELALCEYNAGPRRAMLWKPANVEDDVRPRITISSTLSYVNAIISKYAEYKKDNFGRIDKGPSK